MVKTNIMSLIGMVMGLAITFFSTQTFALDKLAISLQHSSDDPAAEGLFIVELDEQGIWSHQKNTKASWRMGVGVTWYNQPVSIEKLEYFISPPLVPGAGTWPGTKLDECAAGCNNFDSLAGGPTFYHYLHAEQSDVFDNDANLNNPAGICHLKRSALLKEGLPLNTILKNDWLVKKPFSNWPVVTTLLKYHAESGGGLKTFAKERKVSLTTLCKGNPAIADAVAPLPEITVKPTVYTVDAASQELTEQYGPTGLCKVLLDGALATNHPNTKVRFRYEHTGGEMSEIKEVTTGKYKLAVFQHEYNIPNQDGPEGGAIRMIGVEPAFESDWSNYSMDCVEPGATGVQANLPPQLHMQVGVLEQIMVGNQLCPSKLFIHGKMTGLGSFSGQVAFVGDSYLSPPQNYSIENGEIKLFGASRNLNWNSQDGGGEPGGLQSNPNPTELKSKTVQLGMNVTNENNLVIASIAKKGYTFDCVHPQISPTFKGKLNGELNTEPGPVEAVPVAKIKNPVKDQTRNHSASTDKAIYKGLPDLKVKGLHVYSDKTKKSQTVLKSSEAKQVKNGQCIYEMMYHSKNKGKSKTGPYENKLKLNGMTVNIESKKNMLAGQSEKIMLTIGLKQGLNKLVLKLDSKKQVTESKETNNVKVKNITVTGSCKVRTSSNAKTVRKTAGSTRTKSGIRKAEK